MGAAAAGAFPNADLPKELWAKTPVFEEPPKAELPKAEVVVGWADERLAPNCGVVDDVLSKGFGLV